jgi:two-component system chemotaxis sensor kinase CheA
VRTDKLDELAKNSGELLVAARAVLRQSSDWLAFRDDIARWSREWSRRGRSNVAGARETADLEAGLQGLVQQADRLARGATAKHGVLERGVDDVVGGVRRLRLRAMSEVLEALPRAVRDIATRTGKRIDLQIEGDDIEADRIVIDALREPLLHLVRNAADHGIEPPAERAAAGKAETGTVRISTVMHGGRLRVVVEDDGAGVDADGVRQRIASRGETPPTDDRQLAWLLLGGGISTRAAATELSGRGVGLDLVRTSLERIGGTVRMTWRAGRGTRFVLEAPPTPAALRAVLVCVGGQIFALPASNVERLVRVAPEQVRHLGGRLVLPVGGRPIPLVSLAAVLGPPLHPRPLSIVVPAVLLESGDETVALMVDELVDATDIVIRPLERRAAVPHITGGALLATGSIALVLTPGSIVQAALRRTGEPGFADASGATAPRRVLVADDSITTRTLEQSVLEAAGYLVTLAVDGEDAWEKLQAGGTELIVADVEMPRVDGFELCRRVRASQRFAEVPIVLVTGLESAADRARGLEAGADAYITKSGFDQKSLLDTIQQIIG